VRLRTLGTQGIVTALSADKGNLEGEAELQVGVLRVRARLADLELSVPSEPPPDTDLPAAVIIREALPGQADFYQASPGLELDLRGKRADDAIDELERYLDAAFVAGLPFVRVIHGKGTGKLREVVRQFLRGHAHVRSFESGGDKEGGDGVTVIKLA
jgi:DNA mismatch repair protein MutS2